MRCKNCHDELIQSQHANKFDDNKPPLNLIPTGPLLQIANVLGHGAKKYDAHNWRKGMDWSRLIAATLRHITAFNAGEDLDPESGLSHLAHAACGLMFLEEYRQRNIGNDDRYIHRSQVPGLLGQGYIEFDEPQPNSEYKFRVKRIRK